MKNIKTHIALLLVIGLGLFMLPKQTYACASKSVKMEKAACKKMQAGKHSATHDCCKGHKQHKKECNGNCKSCVCSNVPASHFSVLAAVNLNTQHAFAEVEKSTFGYKVAHYSSGYYSIWLPPKIS